MGSQHIVLHLLIRVKPENQNLLLDFLREAVPFYERPGGITIRLLQHRDDPLQFIEIVEYNSLETFEQDHKRVDSDAEMKLYLARWHSFLDGKAQVEAYYELTDQIKNVP